MALRVRQKLKRTANWMLMRMTQKMMPKVLTAMSRIMMIGIVLMLINLEKMGIVWRGVMMKMMTVLLMMNKILL